MDQARGLDLNSDSTAVVENQEASESVVETLVERPKCFPDTEAGDGLVGEGKDVVVLGRGMEVDAEAPAIVKVDALAPEVVASPDEVPDEVGEIVCGDQLGEGGDPCVERVQDAVSGEKGYGSLDGCVQDEGFVCSREQETGDASVDLNLEAPVAAAVEGVENKELDVSISVRAVEDGAEEIRDKNEAVEATVTAENILDSGDLEMSNGSGSSQNLEVGCAAVAKEGVECFGLEDLPCVEAVQAEFRETESGNELQEECLSHPERNQPVLNDVTAQVSDDGSAQFVQCPVVSGEEEIVGRSGAEKFLELGSTLATAELPAGVSVKGARSEILKDLPDMQGVKAELTDVGGGVAEIVEEGEICRDSTHVSENEIVGQSSIDGGVQAMECNLGHNEQGTANGLSGDQNLEAGSTMEPCTADAGESLRLKELEAADGSDTMEETMGASTAEAAESFPNVTDEGVEAEGIEGEQGIEGEPGIGSVHAMEETMGASTAEAAESFPNVTAEGVEAEGIEGEPGIGSVHANVGEIGSGAAEPIEEGTSLQNTKQSSENSIQLSEGLVGRHIQDAGILASRELEETDASCSDLKEETAVMGMGSTMETGKAAQQDFKCLDGVKDSARLEALETSNHNELVEEDSSCLEINQGVVHDAESCVLSDIQDQVIECVPGPRGNGESHIAMSIEFATATEVMETGSLGKISKAAESDGGTEASFMSLAGSEQEGDHEAIHSRHFGDHDPRVIGSNISGKEINKPDTILLDDSAICQPDLGSKDLLTANPVAMVKNLETEPVNQNTNDQVLVTANLDAFQAVPVVAKESGDACLVPDSLLGTKGSLTNDVDSATTVVDVGAGPLGEDLMLRRDMLMHNSKSSPETKEQKNSELPGIQIGGGQRKELVNSPPGENQESQTCSVCPSVDGSPWSEHNILGPSSSISDLVVDPATSGTCQNVDMEFRDLKEDTSPQDGPCLQMEVLKGSEDRHASFPEDHEAQVVADVGADGDQIEQVYRPEVLIGADELSVKQAEISGYENNQHASYFLPIKKKADVSVSDLVWGKVRSHPWWPGQIFDSSDASEMALKHHKKENFLVAYFGDKTFAWCEESQLKPFQKYFSQLENQSSSDAFICAVNEALGELSRREELGMMCCCMPEEAYGDIKYQKVDNAGIREGMCSSIIDRSQIVNNFQPEGLLEYVKTLAQFPRGGADRLELIIAQAQLRAFYHSKGYSELRYFFVGGGLVENEDNMFPVEQFDLPPSDFTSMKGRFRGNNEDILRGNMTQKSLSELEDEEELFDIVNDGAGGFELETSCKLVACTSGEKRKALDSDSDGIVEGKKNKFDLMGDFMPKAPSPMLNGSFKVGEFIRRAASHLTVSPPILKCQGDTFQRSAAEGDYMGVDVFGIDVLPYTPTETLKTRYDTEELPCPTEMLSQLCLAATDPLKRYSFLSTVVDFFTDFRQSSCASAPYIDRKHIEKMGGKRGRRKATDVKVAYSETLMVDYMSDSYWSDVIAYNSNEEEPSYSGHVRKEAHVRGRRKKRKPEIEPERSLAAGTALDSTKYRSVKQELVPERPIIGLGVKLADESTPTALVLCFNKPDSVPSETNLTRIFSRYGPLKETEREVLDKASCAKVVFRRRADAERAFSSARKFSFFGPALISYQLKSLPLTSKASSNFTPKDKTDATTTGGDSSEVPVQLEVELGCKASSDLTSKDNMDATAMVGNNLDVPAQLEAELGCKATSDFTPKDNMDATATVGNKLDVPAQLEVELGCKASSDFTPKDNMDATASGGDDLDVPDQLDAELGCKAASDFTPKDNMDVTASGGNDLGVPAQLEAELGCKASSDFTPNDNMDATATGGDDLDVPAQLEAEIVSDTVEIKAIV